MNNLQDIDIIKEKNIIKKIIDICIVCGNELLTDDTITNGICENCDDEHY